MLKARCATFQLYHGENKLVYDEMMIKSVLYYTNIFSLICIVPSRLFKQQSTQARYLDFNQYVLLLLNVACLEI
jgi:hypothetical protein